MAQQIINDAITCKVGTGITATTSDIPVRLVDSDNATDPTPTVAATDGTDNVIYGKLEATLDAFGDATGVSGNQITYDMGANVIVDGIVEFTKSAASVAGDIGLGVQGAANNQVDTHADGTGRVVARNGTTLWVDLRA